MKELSEKSEVLQEEVQQKKNWEIRAAASEKQIEQLQVRQRWGSELNCAGSVDLPTGLKSLEGDK